MQASLAPKKISCAVHDCRNEGKHELVLRRTVGKRKVVSFFYHCDLHRHLAKQ